MTQLSIFSLVIGTVGSFVGLLISARYLINNVRKNAIKDADVVRILNKHSRELRRIYHEQGWDYDDDGDRKRL